MENSFYYADLQVTVLIQEDIPSVFEDLTDNERHVLLQQFYLTLTTFLSTRALYLSDDKQKGGG